jgi:hypothetical protein
MKHYTIPSDTEAAALRPFASEPLKVGHIITPSVGIVTHTAWDDYPEADALTFEQCMAIVRDEVTPEAIRSIADGMKCDWWAIDTFSGIQVSEFVSIGLDKEGGDVFITFENFTKMMRQLIPNPTATKIKLLAAILRGENI